ncbi:MAG TPA: hypothetical protein VEQ59_16600 [Polyangiaceae bacterium]|nr:hypothetical protein [Polyangiaceae bacterium]
MEWFTQLPEVHPMALYMRSAPFVRSFSFDEGEGCVTGGSAVMLAPEVEAGDSGAPSAGCLVDSALFGAAEAEDFSWSEEQTAAFLRGDPLTLGWVTQAPEPHGRDRVYVCCWLTLDND